MNRVFFPIENHKFDVSGAGEFGQISYLLGREKPSPLDLQATARALETALEAAGYDPECDFVALTGPTIQVAILLSVAMTWGGLARVLLFDAVSERYLCRVLTFEEAAA